MPELGGQTNTKQTKQWYRNSEDSVLKWEGRRLLGVCQEMGWTILNGRAKGDEEGKLTYVGPKANSTSQGG